VRTTQRVGQNEYQSGSYPIMNANQRKVRAGSIIR
jgi:hypothetical protein